MEKMALSPDTLSWIVRPGNRPHRASCICFLSGEDCPATDCFCDASRFWGYSYWDGTGWQSYAVGAGTSVISATDAIEGWHWGEFGAPQAPVAPALAADRALTWLRARQDPQDGGFGNLGGALESMLALGANHERAGDWRRSAGSPTLEEYVFGRASDFSQTGAAAAGKLALALPAAGACIPSATLAPNDTYSPTLGAYSTQMGAHVLALLGTAALSETVPVSATAYLHAQMLVGGGWEWAPGWGADTNSTALGLQALMAAGESKTTPAVLAALAFLHTTQNADGGFPYAPGPVAASDTNSTAYVVQALIAVGEDPAGADWTVNGQTPVDYLLGLQLGWLR